LENKAQKFPTLGKNAPKVSNPWKNKQQIFQPLEKRTWPKSS
jgi:hypothetical protein